jgi:hypothetical protein
MWLLVIFFILAIIGNGSEGKKRMEAQNEEGRRRKAAEDYIMNSGDAEAIKAMMLARANPSMQGQFPQGTSPGGNSVLKTAAGVAAGVVVGEVVAGAVAASAVSHALTEAAKSSDFSDLL